MPARWRKVQAGERELCPRVPAFATAHGIASGGAHVCYAAGALARLPFTPAQVAQHAMQAAQKLLACRKAERENSEKEGSMQAESFAKKQYYSTGRR